MPRSRHGREEWPAAFVNATDLCDPSSAGRGRAPEAQTGARAVVSMHKSTLVVDEDEGRRRALVKALSGRGIRYLDVADAFGAMAALGRADFRALVAAEGRRILSLRGLFQLARRRQAEIDIFVLCRAGSEPETIPGILGVAVECLDGTASPDDLARELDERLNGPPGVAPLHLSPPLGSVKAGS
jgi:hypothetical protein